MYLRAAFLIYLRLFLNLFLLIRASISKRFKHLREGFAWVYFLSKTLSLINLWIFKIESIKYIFVSFFVRARGLSLHPLITNDWSGEWKEELGINGKRLFIFCCLRIRLGFSLRLLPHRLNDFIDYWLL